MLYEVITLRARPVFRKSKAPAPKKNDNGIKNGLVQINRIFHPIPQSEWESLEEEERNNCFDLAGITNRSFRDNPNVEVRRCRLPFYDDVDWYHIEDARNNFV